MDCDMNWRLHWLEAEGSLNPWRGRIIAELEAAHQAVAAFVEVRLDALKQHIPISSLERRPGQHLQAIGPDGVLVPSSTWKAIYDPEAGGGGAYLRRPRRRRPKQRLRKPGSCAGSNSLTAGRQR